MAHVNQAQREAQAMFQGINSRGAKLPKFCAHSFEPMHDGTRELRCQTTYRLETATQIQDASSFRYLGKFECYITG